MLNSFSEREKIIIPVNLKPTEMPIGLKNRLWNATENYIDNTLSIYREEIIEVLWDRFFKKDLASLQRQQIQMKAARYYTNPIKENFYALTWNEVYDFLEFLIDATFCYAYARPFIKTLNSIFEDEKAPYRIIDSKITPLISGVEAEEIGKAINHKYQEVHIHLKKAHDLYCKRPEADYKNSIKESISAVEALARIILKEPNSTLGKMINQLNIHPGLKSGISAMYGWTSDEGGIRHAVKSDVLNTGEEEARFMLVQCSALVNFITSKCIL